MVHPRLSNHSNGKTDHSTSKVQEEATTFKSGTPMLDGGNSSDTRMLTLSTRKVRSWTSQVTRIGKTRISLSGTDTTDLTNNGISSMLMK
jgi:hypothetical protein